MGFNLERRGGREHYDLGFFDHESSRFECAENLFEAESVTHVNGMDTEKIGRGEAICLVSPLRIHVRLR